MEEVEGAIGKLADAVAMEVEEEDRLATWVGDAEAAEAKGTLGTARAVLAYALRVFPDKRDLWRRAANLEKEHGTKWVPMVCRGFVGC